MVRHGSSLVILFMVYYLHSMSRSSLRYHIVYRLSRPPLSTPLPTPSVARLDQCWAYPAYTYLQLTPYKTHL
ncbi:hypothetical protein GGR58DRAFT_483332, partial [Xylaria digitata]